MLSTPSQPPRRPRPPGARRPTVQIRLASATTPGKSTLSAPTTSMATVKTTPTKPTARTTPSSVAAAAAAAKRKGKAKALTPVASATATVPSPAPLPTPPAIPEPATEVNDASFTSSPGLARARPLSMMSETSMSAASPPPPYRHGPASSPEHLDKKTELPMFPPPPPEPLESGPSSVRTSFVEDKYDDHDAETDDEAMPGNTLTLRGLRRLLQDREREEAMAQEVSARLVPYGTFSASLPNVLDVHSNPSPTSTLASPLGIRFTPSPYRPAPSDPSIAFSLSKSRWRPSSSASRDYDRHLAYLHAQEEEERIAALEDALAEARDSEEAQRKANARLRRDNTKLRQQLEHAEDAVAEHIEQASLRSSTSSVTSSPYTSLRRHSTRPSEDTAERMGWGTNSFPEFPRDADWPLDLKALEVALERSQSMLEVQSEATSEATQRPSREVTPRLPADPVMENAMLKDELQRSTNTPPSGESSTTSTASDHPTVVLPSDRARNRPSRPTVSSETFMSPHKSTTTPRLTVEVGSNPGSVKSGASRTARRSPYPSPHPSPRIQSPRLQRSDSERSNSGTTSEKSSLGPHRRGPSLGNSTGLRAILNNATKESFTPIQGTPTVGSHVSPVAALAARMDSVRSYVSDYLGRRTLGSELGSNYSPSPLGFSSPNKDEPCKCPAEEECTCNDVTVEFEINHLAALQQAMKVRRKPSPLANEQPREVTPTATFVLRGSLSRATAANAYEMLYEGNAKHIRWAPVPEPKKVVTNWSPQSWPSPSPSPRVAPLPLPMSDDESDEQLPFEEPIENIQGGEGSQSTALAKFAGSTPVSRIQGPVANSPSPAPNLLAPGSDPWDEYSDRATPSPRTRALRPLLLCSKPAVHARSSSLAHVHRRSASAASGVPPVRNRFASGNGVPHPAIMTHRRNASLLTTNPNLPRVPAGPVTIPGRIMHDLFCLILVILDYIEWGIILVYRLLIDIRAGPDAAITRRRNAQRYYV